MKEKRRTQRGAFPRSLECLLLKLKRLPIGSKIQFMRPGAAVLLMQLPVGLCNGIRMQQAVSTGLRRTMRSVRTESLAVDSSIDHHMRDVYALRAVFAWPRRRRRTVRALAMMLWRR